MWMSCRTETAMQGAAVWAILRGRRHSASKVVGATKLEGLIRHGGRNLSSGATNAEIETPKALKGDRGECGGGIR